MIHETLKERISVMRALLPFEISAAQLDLLSEYALMLKLSPRKSFASWDSDETGAEIHFRDTFLSIPDVDVSDFIDIGSGAGIPGIIYAVLWERSNAVLLDSALRRCEFMQKAVDSLGISARVSVLCERAETAVKKTGYRKQFQLVCARALAPFDKFMRYVRGFVRDDGYILALRGEKDRALFEINRENPLARYGFILKSLKTYRLNSGSAERFSALLVSTGDR